jgi:hypothetical protein
MSNANGRALRRKPRSTIPTTSHSINPRSGPMRAIRTPDDELRSKRVPRQSAFEPGLGARTCQKAHRSQEVGVARASRRAAGSRRLGWIAARSDGRLSSGQNPPPSTSCCHQSAHCLDAILSGADALLKGTGGSSGGISDSSSGRKPEASRTNSAMSKLCGSSIAIRQLVAPASCISSFESPSESRMDSQPRAVCIENLRRGWQINTRIRNEENDSIVHGILEYRSSSETEADTRRSLGVLAR